MKKLSELETKIKETLKNDDILVDSVTYEKTTGNYNVLRVVLDKVGGIDLDLIVEATNKINPLVDEADISEESYILDVSSKERGGKNGQKEN